MKMKRSIDEISDNNKKNELTNLLFLLKYKGQFQDGKRNGIGKLFLNNEQLYYHGQFQMENLMVLVIFIIEMKNYCMKVKFKMEDLMVLVK